MNIQLFTTKTNLDANFRKKTLPFKKKMSKYRKKKFIYIYIIQNEQYITKKDALCYTINTTEFILN